MDNKWIKFLAAGGRIIFEKKSDRKSVKHKYANLKGLRNYCLQLFPLKMWRDSTKHYYSPDVCNSLAYISLLGIWLLVQALSWEAPLRVKVYFQCAYLYSSCLNGEAEWSEIFAAIRPGNWGLEWIKIHLHGEMFVFSTTASTPKINAMQHNVTCCV